MLSDKKDVLDTEIKSLLVQQEELKSEVAQSLVELQNHKTQKEDESRIVYEAQNNLKQAKEAHELNVLELSRKQKEVSTKEDSLNAKIAKLKEIIQ